MTVYVDPLYPWRDGHLWCHMVADTAPELHAFAERIGLKRCWAHTSHNGILHYDLRPNKRDQAIICGAVPVACGELLRLAKYAQQNT